MELDVQTLFNGFLSLVLLLLGTLMNRQDKKMEVQDKRIDLLDRSIRSIPEKYVPKEDYREDMKEIKGMLHDIRDKLDKKQDRVSRHAE